MTKRIVIVGGGYAGCQLAKQLDSKMDVVLVDPKECFFHAPAAIRAAITPALVDDLLIPYNDFLEQGTIIKGWVESIGEDGVVLADGTFIEADIIVVATGSAYASPFKVSGDSIEDFRNVNNQFAAQVNTAQTVAVVGGGPVGVELVGEIIHAYPNKKVHLVAAESRFFPMYKSSLSDKLSAQLSDAGVNLHLGKTVENLQSTTRPFTGELTLDDGSVIAADLIVPAVGSRPTNTLLKTVADVEFDPQGRAVQDSWFRPSPSHPSLFVAGDAAATGDGMTIVGVSRQIPWLAKTILGLIDGSEIQNLKPYAPWPLAPILIPLGPNKGVSILPIGKSGMVVGSFLTSRMKGKDLFISKYRKFFNAT